MAPELKKLRWDIDGVEDEIARIDGCKADIYSLGITMLSLIYPKTKSPSNLIKKLEENIKLDKFIYEDLFIIV